MYKMTPEEQHAWDNWHHGVKPWDGYNALRFKDGMFHPIPTFFTLWNTYRAFKEHGVDTDPIIIWAV